MWPKKLKKMPRVKLVMTPFPYSIEEEEPLEKAREMMASHKIHHLPVMAGGAPVGVISHRDLMRTREQGLESGNDTQRVADSNRATPIFFCEKRQLVELCFNCGRFFIVVNKKIAFSRHNSHFPGKCVSYRIFSCAAV